MSRQRLRVFSLLVLALLAHARCLHAQTEPAPAVGRVHWVTIHVRTPETFDAIYSLLSRDLELPVYFSPEKHGSRHYAAVLAGSVILEPCGPFPDSPYRAAADVARWNTLSFRPLRSTAASVAALDRQGIKHEAPRRETWDNSQVNVNITGLSAPGMPVSICECVEKQQELSAKLDSLRAELTAKKGGPFGIRCLDEIHIGYSTGERLSRWQKLLAPTQPTSSLWPLSAPPHLRFVRSDRDEIVAITFKVESLAVAADRLKSMNLLGEKREDSVAIAESRTCGLKIYLKQ